MPTMPWTTISDLDPQHEYFVMATRFTVTRHRHIPEVVRATQTIWQMLVASDGLLGDSLRAGLADRTLSTLSVWWHRDAMNDFVRSAAHASVVKKTRRRMAGSTFASWTAFSVDLPPTWATADSHINDPRRGRRLVAYPHHTENRHDRD